MNIKTVVVFVELEDGSVHQVLCRKEIKDLCLKMMTSETGSLQITKETYPLEFGGDKTIKQLKNEN